MNGNPPEEPKYTIEQVELLRRLRNSGLTKSQIIQALERMDRVDTSGFSIPADEPKINNNNIANFNLMNSSPASEYLRNIALQQAIAVATLANGSLIGQNKASLQSGLANQRSLAEDLLTPQLKPNGIGGKMSGSSSYLPTTCLQQQVSSVPSYVKREGTGPNVPLGDPSAIKDDDKDLMALQAMSVVDSKEEIKTFMMCHGIKQHQVAEKTGVSQSYISQFLHQGVWMKDSTRTNIYKWYLDERRKREVSGEMVVSSRGSSPNLRTSPNLFNSPAVQATSVSPNRTSPNVVSPPSGQPKKRDRFVWKENCVALLEKYYEANPYPDDTRREEIAAACNQLNGNSGSGQEERVVTAVKVYNWFANRRKEVKRKNASQEGMKSEPLWSSDQLTPANQIEENLTNEGSALMAALSGNIPRNSPKHFTSNGFGEMGPCTKVSRASEESSEFLESQLAEVDHTISALVAPDSPSSEMDQFDNNQPMDNAAAAVDFTAA